MAIRKGRCRLPELLGDMSPTEFARRMRVNDSSVTRWISGDREMTYYNAVKAAMILGCHAEDLYEWFDVKGNRL